jgi:D-lactate dehydrogenase (cytochrome)
MSPLIQPCKPHHTDYLKDESRTSGKAESISFPKSETEVRQIVKALFQKKIPITVQGSRTGITGAAVPLRGHLLNLSVMTKITGLDQDSDGIFSIRVQPGLCLSELNHQLASGSFDTTKWSKNSVKTLDAFKKAEKQFWPPDPTENSASIGGIAANNARGICAHHYGPASRHISSIRVVDTKGNVNVITRNLKKDLLNLYLGSEGMLGAITELTLTLQPLPEELWGIVFFFKTQPASLDFIEAVTCGFQAYPDTKLASVEFMDQTTLKCIEKLKQENSRFKPLPDIHPEFTTAVYLEIHGSNSKEIETFSNELMKTTAEFGCDPDTSWAFCGQIEIQRVRLFRHAAPESVNAFIDKVRQTDSRIRKLGTDMQILNGSLLSIMEMYQADLHQKKLKAAIFGHAADCHLHVNILPEDHAQFIEAKKLIEKWAAKICSQGGSVVTEHGVGKIKKHLFRNLPLQKNHASIALAKQHLDPKELWNPGNMLNKTRTKPVTGLYK